MDLFDFDWLENIKNVIGPNDGSLDTEYIEIPQIPYPIRFGTSTYTGYVITIEDRTTEEIISFNCDKMDIEPDNIESTYRAMIERFGIESNGAYFPRKDTIILSVTVPKEVYKKITNKEGI